MEHKFQFLTPEEINWIFTSFKKAKPSPKTELIWLNNYTLLVSVVLSAQSTDKSVNKATQALYALADTPAKMLELGEEALISHIKTIGLYRSKAKHIMEISRILTTEYGPQAGKDPLVPFPRTRQEFERLPGVGRKSASVMLNVVYGQPTMPVDTHLLRIAPRMGLSNGKTPKAIEEDLLRIIPQEFLCDAHHWLILHGRYVCTARKPKCMECIISSVCKKNDLVAGTN